MIKRKVFPSREHLKSTHIGKNENLYRSELTSINVLREVTDELTRLTDTSVNCKAREKRTELLYA